VQHPLGEAWPVDAGLVKDRPPNVLADGSSFVWDNDVVDCATSVARVASPVKGAAWTSDCLPVEEPPPCMAVPIAYARVTETNNTAIHGSSQRALIKLMRANPLDRVMPRPLQAGRTRH
jgi:hypothetical protein